MYYSKTLNGFIPAAWREDGTYSVDNWPADAILLTEDERAEYCKKTPAEGKQIDVVGGRLAWVDLPPLTLVEIEGAERSWRDGELAAVMWLRERHRDQLGIGVDTTISAEQFTELLIYMQALRDWPQSPNFPASEHRPVLPAWIADQTK